MDRELFAPIRTRNRSQSQSTSEIKDTAPPENSLVSTKTYHQLRPRQSIRSYAFAADSDNENKDTYEAKENNDGGDVEDGQNNSENCLNLPRLTTKLKGKIIQELIGPTKYNEELVWLLKFQSKRRYNIVAAPLMNQYFPQKVIQFYQARLYVVNENNNYIKMKAAAAAAVHNKIEVETEKETDAKNEVWTQRLQRRLKKKPHNFNEKIVKKYRCDVCGFSFRRSDSLTSHKVVHSNKRPFKCPMANCKKTFKSRGNLGCHMTFHSNARPFRCNYPDCGMKFKRKSNLNDHYVTHSDYKPFQCTQKDCGKSFKLRYLFNQHLRQHSNKLSRKR